MEVFVKYKELLLDIFPKTISLKYVYEYENSIESLGNSSSKSDGTKTMWILF